MAEEEDSTYSLEAFEIFIFSVPKLSKTLVAMFATGIITGSMLYLIGSFWNTLSLETGFVELTGALITAGILSGEIVFWIIKDYPRKWSYFLTLVNEVLASLVLVSFTLSGFAGFEEIIWIAAGVIALNTLEVLIITTSLSNIVLKTLASTFQAIFFLGILELTTGVFSWKNLFLVLSSMIFVIASAKFAERLVWINEKVKGFEISSALTLNENMDLDIGQKVRRPIQKLEIKNKKDDISFLSPFFHPGLISKIGGGKMSIKITESLNEEGNGFYFNAPATHKSDLADPKAIENFISNQPEVENFSSQSSQLLKKEEDKFTLYGRRYGNKEIVYIQSKVYDDIEVDAYIDIINPEKQIIIDCHKYEPENAQELRAGTVEAEKFRKKLKKFLEKLEKMTLHEYKAGFHSENGEQPIFALKEVSNEEKTLIVCYEGNNGFKIQKYLENLLEDSYDHLLILTTDSHKDPHSMNEEPDKKDAREVVRLAENNVSKAKAGFNYRMSKPTKILRESYTSMISSFNITARLFILSLAAIYVYLALFILIL